MRLAAIPLALALTLAACQQPSPSQRAWPPYSAAAAKILGEYDTAMNGLANVDLALAAPNPPQKGGIQPMNNDQAVSEIEKTVIPILNQAAAEANGIEFKSASDLATLHQILVQGLALKAESYRTLVAAFRARNAQQFDDGVAKLTQADALMGNFRSMFQQGVMDGSPPELRSGFAPQPRTTKAETVATPSGPIPGLPPMPGMH